MTVPKLVAKKAIEIKNRLNAAYEEYRSGNTDGYCHHGTYVGGCGIDWMCYYCESGYSNYEVALGAAYDWAACQRKVIYDDLWNFMLKEKSELWELTSREKQKEIVDHFTDLLKAIKD